MASTLSKGTALKSLNAAAPIMAMETMNIISHTTATLITVPTVLESLSPMNFVTSWGCPNAISAQTPAQLNSCANVSPEDGCICEGDTEPMYVTAAVTPLFVMTITATRRQDTAMVIP